MGFGLYPPPTSIDEPAYRECMIKIDTSSLGETQQFLCLLGSALISGFMTPTVIEMEGRQDMANAQQTANGPDTPCRGS